MASPDISRSASAIFAPGPHRRSHPDLKLLSLAPLTPKYPIEPADYDAYFNPATSELHTSASLSHIATLPSPGGILTNSPARSRNTSRTRRKKAKPNVHVQLPQDLHISTTDHTTQSPAETRTVTSPHLKRLHTDPSWIVQAGLSLTECNRESKGQSWISKRDSSTSLANTPIEGYFDIARRDGRTPRSGRATPARSRVTSRNTSRNASRSRLQTLHMTSTDTAGASFITAPEVDDQIIEEDESINMDPQWADPKTQAEMAAHLEAEFGHEHDGFDDDPYGMLDFTGQGDISDEEEAEEAVRRVMKQWRVGGWFEGAVDALLMAETANDDERLTSKADSSQHASNEVPTDRTLSFTSDSSDHHLPNTTWFTSLLKRNIGL